MKILLTLIAICLCFTGIGQTYSKGDFAPYPIPIPNSEAWYKLDTSKASFAVSINGGQLLITKDQKLSGKEYTLAEGKLLALDLGEWGGGLYYRPDDTLKQTFYVNGEPVNANNKLENYNFVLRTNPARTLIRGKHLLLAGGNTPAIVPYKDNWFFIQGLPVGPNHGWLSQLVVQRDSFVITKILNLDAMPTAISVYNDEVFIATFDGFMVLRMGRRNYF